MIGDANSDNVLILGGLQKDEKLYLSTVPGMEEDKVELLEEMNGLRNKKEEPESAPEPSTQQFGGRKPGASN